jgi:hypothetical protein
LGLARDPAQFIRYWNYKGAILSGAMRAPIFLVTYLVGKESVKLALGAGSRAIRFSILFRRSRRRFDSIGAARRTAVEGFDDDFIGHTGYQPLF